MLRNIEFKTWKKKPGDEALRVLFKFPRRVWDQRLADFNRFWQWKHEVVTSV